MKTLYARVLPLVLAVSAMATPSCADGVDLIREGWVAERVGRRHQALDAYTRAIQAADLTDEQLAFAHYRRGGVKGFLGDHIGGIEDFSRSIELNPKSVPPYSLRGYLRGVVGQYDAAEKDYLAAIDLAQGQDQRKYLPWVLQHYADLWRRRGDFDKALDFCEKAAQAGESPTASFRRAWIYLDMGRTAQAKAEFEKFEQEMSRQRASYDIFWPDELGAISRLRELR